MGKNKELRGLGFSRMKDGNFPFDKDFKEMMGGTEKYECRGCGHIIEVDPLEVPGVCPGCNALDYPFTRIKKEAA